METPLSHVTRHPPSWNCLGTFPIQRNVLAGPRHSTVSVNKPAMFMLQQVIYIPISAPI